MEIQYSRWLRRVAPNPAGATKRIQSLAWRPLFSFIIPIYNSHPGYLAELMETILAQSYPHFEVCMADDGSTRRRHLDEIQRMAAQKKFQFKLVVGKTNRGIAANTNRALDAAAGDFVVLCDHDDRIEPFALEMFALYINRYPDAELLYSDEDMMDERSRRHSPRLQPDWNPDMFISHMYFMHMICCRKPALDRVGRMNPEFDGAQDHDFFLRFTEQAKRIVHVPHILYSWRVVSDSLASDPTAKLYAYDSGTRAIEAALKRRGEEARVVKAQGAGLGVYRVKRAVRDPAVSHVVEALSQSVELAVKSIRSVEAIPVEIVVVAEEGLAENLSGLISRYGVRLESVKKGTNRAGKYNAGAKRASGGHLVFSSENVELLDGDYPRAIIEHTQRSEIGAVGVKLIHPDGTFFHTGMILGVNGVAGYAHRGLFQGPGYWRYAILIRNYSAVSWELMGVHREKYLEVGGFDESLPFYGDIDFCLNLIRKNYRNLYTPYAAGVLKRKIHRRDELRKPEDERILMERHGDVIQNDPAYHPLHTRSREDFGLRSAPKDRRDEESFTVASV